MPVVLPSAPVWALVAPVATHLATRNRRDTSVFVPVTQDQYHCEKPSKGSGALVRGLTYKDVRLYGCRERDSLWVIRVLSLGGLATIGHVVISLHKYACIRRTRTIAGETDAWRRTRMVQGNGTNGESWQRPKRMKQVWQRGVASGAQ